MAIVKNPLNSISASGTINNLLTYNNRSKNNVVTKKFKRNDKKSDIQIHIRSTFNSGTEYWNTLSEQEKKTFQALARTRLMTGYNLFMKLYLDEHLFPIITGKYNITKYNKCVYK